MTAPSHTIDGLVGEVCFALTNTYTPSDDLDKSIRFALHACLMDMVDQSQHAAFRSDGTIATVAGVSRYDLADDFQQMIDEGVKLAASPYTTLIFRPEYEHNALERDRDQGSGPPTHYFVRGKSASTGLWQLQLWPTPSEIATVSYRYRAIPTAIHMTAPGSTAVIDRRFPPQFIPALVSGAVSKFVKYITPQDLQTRLVVYQKAIQDMKVNAIPVSGAQFQRHKYTGTRYGGRLAWRGDPLTGASG